MEEQINCSIYCPTFFKMLNSCPLKDIISIENLMLTPKPVLYEICAVLFSISPYILSFIILINTIIYRTSRSIVIMLMIFIQNFLGETIKNSLRDPRPNYKCNNQFGNPSNHATFYTSLSTWLLFEILFLNSKYRYDNVFFKMIVFICTPFILQARIYLKYHNFEQIFNGCFLGLVVSIMWFVTINFYLLNNYDNILSKILLKYKINNNLGELDFTGKSKIDDKDSKMYQQYLNLTNKHKEIKNLSSQVGDFSKNIEKLGFLKDKTTKYQNSNVTQFTRAKQEKIEESKVNFNEEDMFEDEEIEEGDEVGDEEYEEGEGEGEEGDHDEEEQKADFDQKELEQYLKELERQAGKNSKNTNVGNGNRVTGNNKIPKNKEKYN